MISIAICDDEKYYRELISKVVTDYMETSRKGEYFIQVYESGNEIISDIENLKSFQILFMDISMNDTDGITAAKEIRRVNEKIFIAFITSFIDYSLEGYKVNAIRYLLKDSLELTLPECLDAICAKMKLETETLKLSLNGETLRLLISRIIYIESQKHRLILHLMNTDGTEIIYTTLKKLDEIEKALPAEIFIRVHKSYLVNAGHISRISNYRVFLSNGETLNISRDRYRMVREKYTGYKGKE